MIEDGKIISIIGSILEVTYEREIEKLKIESEKQTLLAVIEEQEKFAKIANQVAHDIGSPLAALSMMLRSCDILPEDQRDIIRQAPERIRDIANNLLSQYQPPKAIEGQVARAVLVSSEILEILSEKKCEYAYEYLDFTYKFSQSGSFAFI